MVTSSAQNQYIAPSPNESESEFVYRAHYALMDSVRDPSQRNQIVWDAWDRSRGNTIRDRAVSYFPPEKYRHVPAVCYFYEHSTMGRDGSEHRYSFKELADITTNQNKRADTDCYSAIASHHTSDLVKGPGREPWTVGFAGVYRLGMVDANEPKWAIFADEFHRKDQLKLFDDRRRRSVEVLRFRNGATPILDPIATLGVDSPRLNLPVARYEGEATGEIERYSFMSMASVGANSSYVPNMEKQQYEFGGSAPLSNTPQGSAMGGNLSPQDIQQIVDAFRAIPEMQWAKQQMQQAQKGTQSDVGISQGSTTLGGGPSEQPPAPMPAPAPMNESPLSLPQVPPTNQPGPASPVMQPNQMYSHEGDEVEKERYEALEAENAQLKERYSSLSEANKKMLDQMRLQHEAIQNLERRACDGDRLQVIDELCEKYQHTGVFDREELMKECLYSNDSEMSNKEFYAHVKRLEATADRIGKRLPTTMSMIPEGVTAQEASEHERYSAVMDRHGMYLPEDAGLDYAQIEDKLIAEGKLAPRR